MKLGIIAIGTGMGIAAALALLIVSPPAHAVVSSSSDVGFTTQISVDVAMTPGESYDLLVAPERWWGGTHSYSGDAKNLRLDAKAGGCFCEILPASSGKPGSVEHARVLYAAPGQQLRLSGALGPLQSEAVTGVLSFVITPTAAGARVILSYAVGGYFRSGAAQTATMVDQVMTEQIEGFKRVADALHH